MKKWGALCLSLLLFCISFTPMYAESEQTVMITGFSPIEFAVNETTTLNLTVIDVLVDDESTTPVESFARTETAKAELIMQRNDETMNIQLEYVGEGVFQGTAQIPKRGKWAGVAVAYLDGQVADELEVEWTVGSKTKNTQFILYIALGIAIIWLCVQLMRRSLKRR